MQDRLSPIESFLCRELSVNCSAFKGHVVRKVGHLCEFGSIPLPRKQIAFSSEIALVLPVLLALAANLLWQNGKAFVTKKENANQRQTASHLVYVVQTAVSVC
jgi:hypothetical protein